MSSIIIAKPDAQPEQLMLLFHGAGADAQSMTPVGLTLQNAFPQAWIISIEAPTRSRFGPGFEWFSVQGVTEDNRITRVGEAMPLFLETIYDWQKKAQVDAARTALVGYSQGAIMALESVRDRAPVAGRVVAFAGRFAQWPTQAPAGTTLHLFHGKRDSLVPYRLTVTAAEHLVRLNADVTADVLPFLGHEIDAELKALMVTRLTTYIPRALWEEAMQTDPGSAPPPALTEDETAILNPSPYRP